MQKHLILASASEIRREMLENAGVEFTTSVARIDEESIKSSLLAENASPQDIADTLAEMKALRVSAKNPEALVIGSDQVLEFQGQLINKPTSLKDARDQLILLRGKPHKLLSAAVIARNGQPLWRHVGAVRLWMRDFSDGYLDAYLSRLGDEALTTVGGYKLEAEGVRLFTRIEGDFFTVLGMPLLEVLNYLTETGVLEK